MVCARTDVSSSAKRNSFHDARNAKIAVTATPPVTTGITTRQSACSLEHPSTFAASSSSSGTASKKLAMSQIDSGSEIVVCASARPNDVSVRPRLRMISTSGAPTAMVGTMRVTSAATMKTRPLGVRNRVMA